MENNKHPKEEADTKETEIVKTPVYFYANKELKKEL